MSSCHGMNCSQITFFLNMCMFIGVALKKFGLSWLGTGSERTHTEKSGTDISYSHLET